MSRRKTAFWTVLPYLIIIIIACIMITMVIIISEQEANLPTSAVCILADERNSGNIGFFN